MIYINQLHLFLNIPIFLTLARLILSIFFLPFLFAHFLPIESLYINFYLAIFFIILGLTDFLDGFLARKYNQETLIGSILDPIADKFLLFSALITLVHLNKTSFYGAIIFISREFFITGLRQVALVNGFKLSVTQNAKYKTFFQFFYISISILNNGQYTLLDVLEYILFFVSIFLSISSASNYYLIFIKNLYKYKT